MGFAFDLARRDVWVAALAAMTTRMVRGSMLEEIRQDYVRTARAKGLSERVVLFRHALAKRSDSRDYGARASGGNVVGRRNHYGDDLFMAGTGPFDRTGDQCARLSAWRRDAFWPSL